MQVPKLVNHDGTLTTDGQKVVNFVEANIHDMEGMDANALNGKSGVFRYAFSRAKINGVSVAQLLTEQEFNFGQNAWGLMHYAEQQTAEKQQIEATAETTSELVKQLEALQTQLTTQAAEIAALKEAQTVEPDPKKPARKPKTETAETEAEDESAE